MLNQRITGVFLAVLLASTAGVATAQTPYKLTGFWYMNRGPLIDIPINGQAAGCGLFGGNVYTAGVPNLNNPGFPDGAHTPAGVQPTAVPFVGGQPNAGCVGILNQPATPTLASPNVGAAQIEGGIPAIPAAQVIVNAGNIPKSFTVQPGAFYQKRGKQVAAVAVAPTVVQLGSTYTPEGPALRTDPTAQLNDRNFRENAWLAQPGRMGANFTWCPPGTQASQAPACTTPANAGGGSFPNANGLIRYRAGANAFGGTMAMMLSGQSTVTIKLDTVVGGKIGNQIAAAVPSGTNLQAPGKGYAAIDVDLLAGAIEHPSYAINSQCQNAFPATPIGCSQVVSSGPATGTGAGDTNVNWGMPWTTGTVTVFKTGTALGQPRTETLTAMGSDSRNAAGAGNITLVAGGVSHRIVVNQNFAALDVVTMTISPYAPTLSPTGISLLGGLIVISAGYVLRRRLS